MLREVADADSQVGMRFWATCVTVEGLSDWGVSLSVWLHGCQCQHEDDKARSKCTLKGRKALLLACGGWHDFTRSLQACELSARARLLNTQLRDRSDEDRQFATELCTGFQDCKSMMLLRLRQAYSFWDAMPFSILQLGQHLVLPSVPEDESRRAGKRLLAEYTQAPSKASLGVTSWFFFGQATNRRRIEVWCQGGPLHHNLAHELLAYASSLVVMQQLESRHHLVNMAVSHGRAQLPCATIAALRRVINKDLQEPAFRDLLPTLLDSFSTLLPAEISWSGKKEMLEKIYGYGLDQLHPDTTFEDAEFQKHTDAMVQAKTKSPDLGPLESDHLKKVLNRQAAFAIPTERPSSTEPQDYIIFKVISLKPNSRMYLQKVCQLSVDEWHDSMAISVLGRVRSKQSDSGATLPEFTTFSLSEVQTLSLRYMFDKSRWRGLHVYTKATSQTKTRPSSQSRIQPPAPGESGL